MNRILKRRRNCWRIGRARAAGLLVDGRSYYRAFCEAARQARRYVLLAGWQFDSAVRLRRGVDASGDDRDAEKGLLEFLNELCARRPRLRVFILAWDFNVFYTMKREFLQSWRFAWQGHERIQFRFDASHPFGASHHQKFVVIDGVAAFVGGMDICEGTWDDRDHRATNPLRVRPDGEAFPPRHDVQAFVAGRAARRLARLFVRRWRFSGGGRLWLGRSLPRQLPIACDLRLAAGRVAISRTIAETLVPRRAPVVEVRQLFVDAIAAAESLLYMEQQYFASEAVYAALVERMRAAHRPKLQIVLILPRQTEAFIEEIGLGATQARYLRGLMEVATRTGHALGIYNTKAGGENPDQVLTFIHAKLMIVDDRFLTIGSANFSNRSMGFDSELNLTWEARTARQRSLIDAIRAARVDLLAEHCGLAREEERRRLAEPVGLVDFLNGLADNPAQRLCRHRIGTSLISEWVTEITPHDLIIDPQKSVIAERLYHLLAPDENGLFAKGITLLNRHLFGDKP